jgi:hypothetical protein
LDLVWDEFDHCFYIGHGASNTRIGYDPLGRWSTIAECTGSTTNSIRYFKWEGYRLAEEQTAAGTVVRRYFPGGFWFNGNNYFYLTDHLGSVRQVTDASGTVVARFTYDPYGKRIQTFGSLQVDIGFRSTSASPATSITRHPASSSLPSASTTRKPAGGSAGNSGAWGKKKTPQEPRQTQRHGETTQDGAESQCSTNRLPQIPTMQL